MKDINIGKHINLCTYKFKAPRDGYEFGLDLIINERVFIHDKFKVIIHLNRTSIHP